MEPGEVRVKAFACSDELPPGSVGRKGDYVLQNSLVTAVVRKPSESLTLVGEPGGGLVDFADWDGQDWLWEAAPMLWGELDTVELGDDWIRLSGERDEITWRLPADSRTIELDGAHTLWLHGDRRSVPVEQGFVRSQTLVLADKSAGDFGGGQAVLQPYSLTVGSLEDVHDALYDTPVSGTCVGDRVEVWSLGILTGHLPTTFDSHVAEGSTLVCTGQGAIPHEVPAGIDLELDAQISSVELRVSDGEHEIPAVVTIDGVETAIDARRSSVPAPRGEVLVTVDAGPRFSVWSEVVEAPAELEVVLEPLFSRDGHVQADLFQVTFPSLDSRLEQNDAIELAAAREVAFVVQTPTQEVGRPYQDDWTERTTRALAGSHSSDDAGAVWSWPWSANDKKAGHGAVDPSELSAMDLLAVHKDYADPDRVTVVDVAWVQAAGPIGGWTDTPTALRLESLDDVPTVLDLLDAGVPIAVTGPVTWLQADDTLGPPSQSAAERSLVQATSCASTGPLLTLEWTLFPSPGFVTHPDAQILEGDGWAIAVLEDGDDWAVSAPLWF